jgi:hypothetical protein
VSLGRSESVPRGSGAPGFARRCHMSPGRDGDCSRWVAGVRHFDDIMGSGEAEGVPRPQVV